MPIRPWTWWLAAGWSALCAIPLIGALILAPLNRNAPDVWSISDPFWIVGGIAYGLVGWLLAARRPGNLLGWIFLAIGLLLALAAFAGHWAVYALETHPGTHGGAHALWLSVGLTVVSQLPIPLLLFPAGRLPNRWARLVAWCSVALAVWFILLLLSGPIIAPGFPALYEQTPNPLAVIPRTMGDAGYAIMLMNLCLFLAIVLLLARFRASRGLTRQQYTWVVLAMVLVVAAQVADVVARASGSGAYIVTGPSVSISEALIPVAMAVAILRYHLFDIDRVVNRVLVYTALTATLALAYGIVVLLFQLPLRPLAPGNDVVVVISTLLVAALFRPARGRIQRRVDRRFNRQRYDAARMIDTFGSRLRHQVDPDVIGTELQTIVAQTMQPAHVSLWLRPTR